MSCASRFSCRWARLVVPGMGMMTGDRASSQASVTWEMVAPCRVAMGSRTLRTASGPPVSVGAPGVLSDTGCQGTKTAPASAAASRRKTSRRSANSRAKRLRTTALKQRACYLKCRRRDKLQFGFWSGGRDTI
jgi:hypothetical protein